MKTFTIQVSDEDAALVFNRLPEIIRALGIKSARVVEAETKTADATNVSFFEAFTDAELDDFYESIFPTERLAPIPPHQLPPEIRTTLAAIKEKIQNGAPLRTSGYATEEEIASLPPDYLKRLMR